MTPQLRRTATTIAALALAAVATPVSTAHAADVHWKTLASINGGKIQACKVPVTSEGPWKIKLRVDATKAGGRVTASVSARRLSVEWSGMARSRPSRRMMEPISPSVCRRARRNTTRSVSAVVIARAE